MNVLHQLIEDALRAAQDKAGDQLNARRSADWVRELAAGLGSHCRNSKPDIPIAVFCRGDSENRPNFRINELLFDVLVAEVKIISSASKGKDLRALSKILWLVESELKRSDSRDVLIDLNKLIVGKAENKLLVISSDTRLVEWTLKAMRLLLDWRESNVFLAIIPHPNEWGAPSCPCSEVYQLSGDAWLTLPLSGQLRRPHIDHLGLKEQ